MGGAAFVTDPPSASTVTGLAGRSSAARQGAVSPLIYILLAGVAVRLLLWYGFRSQPLKVWDEREYHTLAVNLLRYGEYSFNPGHERTSLRPPLYPALVAGVYGLAGEGNLAAVRLLQAAIGLLTVVVAYGLGRAVASRRVANWLAGLLCFYPSLLAYNNLLLTEVLFTLLLTSSCLLIVLSFRQRSPALVAAAGVTLGLAALTRSVVWLAPPFLAAFLIMSWRGRWTERLAAAAAMLLAFAVTLAPWAVRNSRLQDTFVAIDVMGGRNFMMGNYRYTPLYRSWDAISIEGEQSWIHEICSTFPFEMRTSQGKLDKLALGQGLKFVREYPGLTLQRSVIKFCDFWGLEREIIAGAWRGGLGELSKPTLFALTGAIVVVYVVVIALAVFGLFFAPPTDRRLHWLFVCVIAYVCALHTIAFGHSRYHLPLMPLVLLYTAGAVTHAQAIWARRRSLRFGFAVVLCAGLLAGWTWNFFAVDRQLLVAAMQSRS
jgi:4-amino-4-deoxy-L-arabinose transferase-like glycosyltransferase